MDFTLYHYYDASTGPFRNLSDLEPDEAERVLEQIRQKKKGFASKRSHDYLLIRRGLEARAREMFVSKGGLPVRRHPHYMTLGECPWLLDWFDEGQELSISLNEFEPQAVSFTYGDLFPAMRYQDGKPYRGQLYTIHEIVDVIQEFGLPQHWNALGENGPERYIEAQVWDDDLLLRRLAIYDGHMLI